jgi:hypothetical protein
MRIARTSRWSILAYTLAFALLIVSAYLLFEGNTKASLKFVWASVVVSGVSILAALGSVLFPRR